MKRPAVPGVKLGTPLALRDDSWTTTNSHKSSIAMYCTGGTECLSRTPGSHSAYFQRQARCSEDNVLPLPYYKLHLHQSYSTNHVEYLNCYIYWNVACTTQHIINLPLKNYTRNQRCMMVTLVLMKYCIDDVVRKGHISMVCTCT